MNIIFPRIIHQTYKTSNLPDVWKNTPKTWIDHHQGYTYMFWTDDDNRNLIQNHFPWFLKKYDEYEYGIQRADAIRYFILYQYGGIYADLDIEAQRSIDPILQLYEKNFPDSEVLLVTNPNNHFGNQIVTNSIMIAKPNSPFFTELFKNLLNFEFSPYHVGKHLKVMASTGPGMISSSYTNYTDKSRVLLIPHQYLNPCTSTEDRPCTKPEAFVSEINGKSWHDSDSTIYNYVASVPRSTWIAIGIIVLLIVIIIFIRMNRKIQVCETTCPNIKFN